VKKGNVNLEHSLYLLEAELGILESQKKKVAGFYNCAIALAEKRGFLQDHALANEFASAFFKEIGDDTKEDFHLQQAVKSYSEWGATSKVDQLS